MIYHLSIAMYQFAMRFVILMPMAYKHKQTSASRTHARHWILALAALATIAVAYWHWTSRAAAQRAEHAEYMARQAESAKMRLEHEIRMLTHDIESRRSDIEFAESKAEKMTHERILADLERERRELERKLADL